MILLNKKIIPLIQINTPTIDSMRLRDLIEEYIHESSAPSFYQGKIIQALAVSNHIHELLPALKSYLNRYSEHKFQIITGFFSHHNIEHSWLQDNCLIIDISLERVKNHPQLEPQLREQVTPYSYFVSDNSRHYLYQFYTAEKV